MTESTRKKIVYSLSAVAVLWALTNVESDKKAPPPPASHVTTSKVEDVLPSADKVVINIEQKQNQEWGGDPFRDEHLKKKVKSKTTKKLAWVLSGIVYNSSNPVAYINKKAVRVGDTVGNAKVVTIERSSATLVHNGNRFTIHVKRG